MSNPDIVDTDWLDELIVSVCMHSQKDVDGVVTIVYEGLSPAQIKQLIQAKFKENYKRLAHEAIGKHIAGKRDINQHIDKQRATLDNQLNNMKGE